MSREDVEGIKLTQDAVLAGLVKTATKLWVPYMSGENY